MVRAAASFGADAISPAHGFPQGGAVGDPGYRPYVTKKMVRQAHRAHISVIPWTVDDKDTMRKLIDAGVDGIITDYPNRLRSVMRERGLVRPRSYRAPVAKPAAQMSEAKLVAHTAQHGLQILLPES